MFLVNSPLSQFQQVGDEQVLDEKEILNILLPALILKFGLFDHKLDQIHTTVNTLVQRKTRREKKSQTQKLRDNISFQEFQNLISFSQELYKPNLKTRVRLAQFRLGITFLFFTGCRLNEIRGFTQDEYFDALKLQRVEFSEYKTGKRRVCAIPEIGVQAFRDRRDDFEFLFKGHGFAYLGASLNNKLEPMHARSWIRLINSILKEYTIRNNPSLNLKSHSFRISFVTRISQFKGIYEASMMVAISTTQRYARYRLGTREMADIQQGALIDQINGNSALQTAEDILSEYDGIL